MFQFPLLCYSNSGGPYLHLSTEQVFVKYHPCQALCGVLNTLVCAVHALAISLHVITYIQLGSLFILCLYLKDYLRPGIEENLSLGRSYSKSSFVIPVSKETVSSIPEKNGFR